MSCTAGTIYWGVRATEGVVAAPVTGALSSLQIQPYGDYPFTTFAGAGNYWYFAIPAFMETINGLRIDGSPLFVVPLQDAASIGGVAYRVLRALFPVFPDDLVFEIV